LGGDDMHVDVDDTRTIGKSAETPKLERLMPAVASKLRRAS
jgi:hypothetical protein